MEILNEIISIYITVGFIATITEIYAIRFIMYEKLTAYKFFKTFINIITWPKWLIK